MPRRFTWSLLGFVLLVVPACGGNGASPPPVTQAPKPVEAKPAAVPEVETPEKVAEEDKENPNDRYRAGNRRDPFLSILVTTEGRESLENLPPLQRAAIEDLRVIGIIWGEFGMSAMIQTPDGKGYTVRKGTLIGPNRGRIKRITKRFVSVEENYTDIFGERKKREVKLDLHPQKEGKE